MTDIVDWRGHAERLREECEFHLAEIERLREQVLALQHIADRDEAEIERLRETMWTIAHLAEGTRIGGMARAVLEGK